MKRKKYALINEKDEFISSIKKKQSKKIKNKNAIFKIDSKYFLILFVLLLLLYSIFINIYLLLKLKIYKNKETYSNIKYQNKEIQSNNTISNNQLTSKLLKKMSEIYEKNGFVNINEIESTIPEGRSWIKGQNKSKEINVGASFDEKFVLPSILTFASIMASQKQETKIRFHLAVVDGYSIENMIKVYKLRERIRNDVEFNFYNAKRVETDLKGVHTKGNSVTARLLLPELLPDDVERLIIFDTGDLIVI